MTMNNTFKELFGPVKANEALKERTRAYLAMQTRGYAGAKAGKRRYPAYALACACLLFVLLGGGWLYYTPVTEISIDINPSIELGINRFDRVVCVSAFNEDGQALADTLDVKHKNYTQAIEQLLNDESVTALLSGGEVMAITVVGPDRQQSAKLLSGVETCTAGQSNIDCYAARPEEAVAAHEAGLSCGKYRAFLELQRLDPDITPETVQGMTMREIRELISRLSSGSGSDLPTPGGWGNGHHGNGGQGNPAPGEGSGGNGYHGGGQNGWGYGNRAKAPTGDSTTAD